MHPISFTQLLDWVMTEYQDQGSVFGCTKLYTADPERYTEFLNGKLETLVGPAAGPHTQLAQNIVAGYVCGGRIFELKTVQSLDGEDLVVHKPCILAEDEAYNCEWSTELTVQGAFEEYVKAWFLLNFLSVELGLGAQDGFVFNMSVGYDLAGIQSPKVDGFIEGMKDASQTAIFRECKEQLLAFLPHCKRMTKAHVEAISPHICNNISMSTMHGCPAGEIERIARYLICEKGLNLYLKCNPTLLGYDHVRKVLDDLGFDYIQFTHEQFDNDLHYEDAVPMIRNLMECAAEQEKKFGVKLTNTFPVKKLRGELPDETIYMSGRTLLPLSLGVAAMLAKEFDGSLPMSYCGGATAQNIADILSTGIYPITVCTDLLKPGGYHRLNSMVLNLDREGHTPGEKIDSEKLEHLAETLCGPVGKNIQVRRKDRPEEPVCVGHCKTVCGSCATLCPNRANVVIIADGAKHMLHIDGMCNECGNCASFCPEARAPYLEKLTLFCTEEELKASKNTGFAPVAGVQDEFAVRWNGELTHFRLDDDPGALDEEMVQVIRAVSHAYPYLMYR